MFSFDHFSSAPPASITDSGAADSSDQAQAPVSAEVTASEAGGEATPSVTSEAAEAVLAKPEVVNALVVIVSSFNLLGLASCGK